MGNIKTIEYIIPIRQIASFSNSFDVKNYKVFSYLNNTKKNKIRTKKILNFIYQDKEKITSTKNNKCIQKEIVDDEKINVNILSFKSHNNTKRYDNKESLKTLDVINTTNNIANIENMIEKN